MGEVFIRVKRTVSLGFFPYGYSVRGGVVFGHARADPKSAACWRNGAVGRVRGRAVGARGVSARARRAARARVDGDAVRLIFSARGAIRLAGRAARRARVRAARCAVVGKTLERVGRTHRTSCVSRSGSVRSTNPLGCAVITGHGTSVDGSSTIAGAAAARLGAPAPALLTAGMA